MKNKIKVLIACALSAATVSALVACGDGGDAQRYTVKFDTLGGSLVASYSRKVGEVVNRPTTIPTKEMFVFDDWYTDTTFTQKFEFGTVMPDNDLVVYAGWKGETSVMLTLDANGGEFDGNVNAIQEIGVVGSAIPELKTPVNYGYSFGGWYTDAACTNKFTYNLFPTENTTLYACWNTDDSFAYISYYGNGSLLKTVPVKKGDEVSRYEIDGDLVVSDWYSDESMETKYTFGSATVNTNLYSNYYTRGLEFESGSVVGYNGSSVDIVVPNVYGGQKITEIGAYAFNRSVELAGIKTVSLPITIETIGEGAFYESRYLTDITLGSNVKTIGKNAFYKNLRLKNLGDLSAVTSIGEAAFAGCENLRTVELPETLLSLGEYAFTDCKLLEEITLPSKIDSILNSMFKGCKALKTVNIEAPVFKQFANNSFTDCSALETVNIKSVQVAKIVEHSSDLVSPFFNSPNVKICVPSSLLETYKTRYGHLDNNSLKDKFVALG